MIWIPSAVVLWYVWYFCIIGALVFGADCDIRLLCVSILLVVLVALWGIWHSSVFAVLVSELFVFYSIGYSHV